MLRYVRIAVAVFFAIVCLVSCALWVRGLRGYDYLSFRAPSHGIESMQVYSLHGELGVWAFPGERELSEWSEHECEWAISTFDASRSFSGFRWQWTKRVIIVGMPNWFVVLTFGGLAGVALGNHRFSLRAVLITSTLLCVVLGIAAATAQ